MVRLPTVSLLLLHRLEQGALGLRRGAVDLVGEHEAGDQRAFPELDFLAALGLLDENRGALDVGGHHVGRELDPRKLQVERLAQRAHQHGLAEAGHAFEQDVAAGHAGR